MQVRQGFDVVVQAVSPLLMGPCMECKRLSPATPRILRVKVSRLGESQTHADYKPPPLPTLLPLRVVAARSRYWEASSEI